jgi:hypothetical protein
MAAQRRSQIQCSILAEAILVLAGVLALSGVVHVLEPRPSPAGAGLARYRHQQDALT